MVSELTKRDSSFYFKFHIINIMIPVFWNDMYICSLNEIVVEKM